MADKLTEAYNQWAAKGGDNYQAFAAGYSTSAVSMRARAMKEIDAVSLDEHEEDLAETIRHVLNSLKSKIGELSDIG